MNPNDPQLTSPSNPDNAVEGGEADPLIDDGSLDPFAAEGSGTKIRFGSLLIVVVIVIAIGAVFGMRTLAKATAANDTPTDSEKTIDKFLKAGPGGRTAADNLLAIDNESVLGVLTGDYTDHQVPLDRVQRNPFVGGGGGGGGPVDPAELDKGQLQRAMEAAGGKLKLKSVMMSSRNPVAILNVGVIMLNRSVTVQPEGIEFRVVSITADSVTLVAEDPKSGLRVEQKLFLDRDR